MQETKIKKYEGYIFAVFSIPNVNQNNKVFKHSITSTFYIKSYEFNGNIVLNNMYKYGLKKYIIIHVSEKIDKESLTYKGFKKNKIFDDGSSTYIRAFMFSIENFFSIDTLNFFFEKNKHHAFEYVFIFKDISWKYICHQFSVCGLVIGGGSNSRKHVLSPLQLRLSLFLSCIFNNGSNAINEVTSSFHREYSDNDKKISDLSTNEIKKKIISFAQSNENLKSLVFKKLNISADLDDIEEKELEKTNSEAPQAPKAPKAEITNDKKEEIPLSQYQSNISLPCNAWNASARKGVRSYHSSSLVNNSKFNDLKDPEILIDQKNDIVPHKQSNLSIFLSDMKEIIDGVIDENDSDKKAAQLKIEELWLSIIKSRLEDKEYLINHYQGKLLSSFHSAKKTIEIYGENKEFEKKFPGLGKDLVEMEYLILTFVNCISLYSRLSYSSLALRIGGEILDMIYFKKYKNISKVEFKNKVNMDKIDNVLRLGVFFMKILETFPHQIFEQNFEIDSYYTSTPSSLKLNDIYLDDIKNNLLIRPNTLPMICKPNLWFEDQYGGFLLNESNKIDIITGKENMNHEIENKEAIFLGINYLNSIKFGVNNLMLDFILSPEGSYLLENVKPEDHLQRAFTLEVAKLYSKVPFYLNTHADWRGRIYTQSFYLSYQSGDLSVSLLNFWEGEPITKEGEFYLYIYGANSHNENGIGKTSFKERIEWVKKNYERIINLDKELILSADSPFIFTAFCLNMREIHNNPNVKIKTPVFLDATCSGIQQLAGLMKDLELGSYTNLIPSTYEDRPGDIYSVLLEKINTVINKYGENHKEFEILKFVKFERKHIKAPVMTKIYNVTVYGISKQIEAILDGTDSFFTDLKTKPLLNITNKLEESVKSKKNNYKFYCPSNFGKDIILTRGEIFKIAKIINDEIFVVFPSLNDIYRYFMDISNLISSIGLELIWITPAGLKIKQNYLKSKKKVISISMWGKSKKFILKERTNITDKVKQKQAIIPNIIHSLDATHLLYIIKSAKEDKFTPLITVHDCFGTLPNKMMNLDTRVKKEFINLYSNSQFLKNFHNRILQNMKDNHFIIKSNNGKDFIEIEGKLIEIPSLPKTGNLNIDQIIDSKFLIS